MGGSRRVEPRAHSNLKKTIFIPAQLQILNFIILTVVNGTFMAYSSFLGVGLWFCSSSRVTATIGIANSVHSWTGNSRAFFPERLGNTRLVDR